jgi:fluoroacetyl-CoA thioesterase
MKPMLEPGMTHELRFVVPASKTVPALYPESPEFQRMPRVFATGFLVGLLEWACIQAAHPHLTVGTHVDVSHSAPTPPGMAVTVKVKLVEIEGRRLAFQVEAHDGIDLISRGTHQRIIIDRERFDERVVRKQAAS